MSIANVDEAIKLALEEMIEGIQILDHDWRYLYVNQAAARHGRVERSALVGKRMEECYPGIAETPMFAELLGVMKDRKPRRLENQFEYPDGGKCWFELFIEAHPKGVLIRSIEISERKKLEEQLVHSLKLEAIGRLAGGIAHDYNNKLGVMLTFCELAIDSLPQEMTEVRKHIQRIREAVNQSTGLTRQLLAFGRKQVLDLRVVNLNEQVLAMRASLARAITENVTLSFRLGEGVGNMRMDVGQLEQILLNLCLNARDAMPKGGTLIIETANVTRESGEHVMVAVSDTGVGMDKETRDHIFEPFFTTKEIGKGTGLGLSMVYGIVSQSGGHIWVYSEPGLGSVFKLYFPRVRDTVEELPSLGTTSLERAGDETILLVEDDPMLREAYKTLLKRVGYEVYAVSTSTEAECVFMSHHREFDLLLTDLILPEMNGRELSERLIAQKPDLKVVFMSGYTENTIVHQGVLDAEAVLLQKPITIDLLLATMRGVLDGKLKRGVVS